MTINKGSYPESESRSDSNDLNQASGAEIDMLFNLSAMIIFITDDKGYFQRLSAGCTAVLGWERAELMGKPYFEFVHPDDLKKTQAMVSQIVEGTPTTQTQHRFRTKDGRYKWLLCSAQLAADGNIYVVAQDITESKLEERVRQLTLLNELVTEMNLIELREELFKTVATKSAEIVKCDHVSIAMLNENGRVFDVYTCDLSHGNALLVTGATVINTLSGRAVTEKRVIIDLKPEQSQMIDAKGLSKKGMQSIMNVPLIVVDRVIGTLNIASRQNQAYGLEEELLLTQVASLVAYNLVNRQLLEQAETRATQLQTVTDVSAAISTNLDTKTLLPSVAMLTKERFGLYHAHIYVLNEAEECLELVAGAGDIGAQMVREGRTISLDQEKSLVARTARTKAGLMVNDVLSDPGFLAHPLLPETRSEMAVPMLVGDKLLGVLDTQADHVDAFSEANLNILTALAEQIAIALQNARQYEQTEAALDAVGRIYNLSIDMIGAANFEGYFVELNPASEKLLGYQLETLLSTPFMAFIHLDDQPITSSEIARLSRGNITLEFENRVRCYDGSYKWLAWNAVPSLSEKLMYFVARDITERKHNEEAIGTALAETEILYQALEAFNVSRSFDEMIAIIRKYTVAEEAESISIGYFNRPVGLDEMMPEAFEILASWRPNLAAFFDRDYLRADMPSIERIIRPTLTVYDDIQTEAYIEGSLKELYQNIKARTVVYAPIATGGQWLGFLSIIFQKVISLRETDRQRISALTNQLSVSVQNLYNYDRTAYTLRQTQILQSFGQTLTGQLESERVYHAFNEACVNEAGFDYVQFSLVDQSQQRVMAVSGLNISEAQILRSNHPLSSQDIMADIIRTGKTEVIRGWDERFDQENFEAEGHIDWVRVFSPIQLRGENVGLVEVGFKTGESELIQTSRIFLLEAMINQCAIALDNAKRYERRQKALSRERTIREITEKMQTASSVEQLIAVTTDELGKHFTADLAVIGIEPKSATESTQ